MILHWSRQIGKSFTLAAWAVDRLLTRPGRLVTVLSNSRENGAEFVAKCAEVCRLNGTRFELKDKSQGVQFQNMRMEVRIRSHAKTGRIKVLAANPRTARGFSGDLILDEFAFHEDSNAIWEAAEPILASNPDFLCRIASTGNGKHNLFYRMAAHPMAVQSSKVLPHGSQVQSREDENEDENAPSPRPNGFPSPPPVGIPTRDDRFAKRGPPMGAREVGQGIDEAMPSKHEDGALGERRPTTEDEVLPHENEAESRRGEAEPFGETAFPRGHQGTRETRVLPGDVDSPFNWMFVSSQGFRVSRVSRSEAYGMGVRIYDPNTREPITPEVARAQALDKAAYDQNYECAFADENLTLLSHELINAAEREGVGLICEQDWSAGALECLRGADSGGREDGKTRRRDIDEDVVGSLYVGFDVARRGDLSVITVVEKQRNLFLVRGILRMRNLRLPEQQARLGEICRLPQFRRAAIDMTGLGLGLFEYAQEEFGASRIVGINFASSVPATKSIRSTGRKRETVRVTEALAMELLQTYEDRRIWHPADQQLRDDLRKPEKVTTPGGRVSIAATRDEAGHADHFWSFALALEAAGRPGGGGGAAIVHISRRDRMSGLL
jgi:phage FluMu gp28-like protein